MFIIAATIALALRNNDRYSIPQSTLGGIDPAYFKEVFKEHCFSFPIKFEYLQTDDHFYYEPIPYQPDMKIIGYFQSEKFFWDYKDDVIKAFGLNPNKKTIPGLVSLHIRRGDYLQYSDKHPPVTPEYIREAGELFREMGYDRVLVFSDDMAWATQNVQKILPEFKVEFEMFGNELSKIEKMSMCEHNIISNSTFSWWGAYINPNPHKVIVAPKVWFGPGNAHIDSRDIVPENWMRL